MTSAVKVTPAALTAPYSSAIDLTIEARRKAKIVYVFWPAEEKVGVKTVREIVAACKNNGSTHAVIVFIDQITPFAKREIDSYDDITIEQFRRSELQCNITKHALNPQMRVMSKKEGVEIVRKYGGDASHLPKMLSTDAVARYYGLRRGAIMEIVRTSEEGHSSLAHRIVAA